MFSKNWALVENGTVNWMTFCPGCHFCDAVKSSGSYARCGGNQGTANGMGSPGCNGAEDNLCYPWSLQTKTSYGYGGSGIYLAYAVNGYWGIETTTKISTGSVKCIRDLCP